MDQLKHPKRMDLSSASTKGALGDATVTHLLSAVSPAAQPGSGSPRAGGARSRPGVLPAVHASVPGALINAQATRCVSTVANG